MAQHPFSMCVKTAMHRGDIAQVIAQTRDPRLKQVSQHDGAVARLCTKSFFLRTLLVVQQKKKTDLIAEDVCDASPPECFFNKKISLRYVAALLLPRWRRCIFRGLIFSHPLSILLLLYY